LTALAPEFAFHLVCSPVKPWVVNGENGVSQKAAGVGHASYYVSFPLLSVTGGVQVDGRDFSVSGQAWMDHEWFTHELQPDQIGWDWFSVQLENKTELMLFDLRRKDGAADSNSSGTFIDAAGRAHHLSARDFTLKPVAWWNRYPVRWSISIPSLKLQLECRATMPDQELATPHAAKYWEGAVDYSGSARGVGYLEMTGYDKPVRLEE
jgi:predicted secreted hydrolase